ncbi:MAG: protein translocase subunit SecDF [Bacteroidetes bacterium]|nr:protein translocase subunit SecDF [Bacteroidota bacterium]
MKNKGLVIFITVILALTCIYELSFSWKTRGFEDKAKAFATKNGQFSPEKYRDYIDSLGGKTLLNLYFVKKSYFQCKDAELKLGLDLQGGMNVTLEVNKAEVLKSLANPMANKDDAFKKSIVESQLNYQKSGGDFVDIFISNFKTLAPTRSLASLFLSNNSSNRISVNSSDKEIANYLKDELKSKADNTRQVIESRLNSGNISQPNIQQLDNGRISVELPGVDNPTRIRKLLEESAHLEFWEVYGNNKQSAFAAFNKIYKPMNLAYAQKLRMGKVDPTEDSIKRVVIAAIKDSTARDSAKLAYDKESNGKDSTEFPFAKAGLGPYQDQKGNVVENAYLAIASKENINKINKMLEDDAVKNAIPKNVIFAWSAKPIQKESTVYALYALKTSKEGKSAMGSGDENMIADAFATNSQTTSEVEVSMSMTANASKDWRNITKLAAQNKDFIAIVLDNKVFSAPTVNSEIPSGNSSITGGFSVEEATDLANVLKAGKLPAPAQIVAEDVVGPTLGKESIKSGLSSLIVGFISVIILMIVYYKRSGVIATLAVFLNVFFIIGILASMGAALTLPGIAGLVLTIGMAVDANVLIYERIKEELRLGKTIRPAVASGFKAAFSSIIDGNLTTLIAGIIMTFVGAGPVYGFAIVLIIGIITSLFTSIFITRILIEARTEKGKDVSFFNKFSKDLMIGSNFNFIGNRKKSYLLSTAIIVIGMSVLVMKGGLSTGIDFKGGYGFDIQMSSKVNQNEIKNLLDKGLPNSSNEVKTIGSSNRYKIVTTYKINEVTFSADSVTSTLLNALAPYKVTKNDILSSAKVGPTIASNIRTRSAWVIFFSVIAIFIYIVIRFKNISFAVGAIIALIHDVLMVFAIFALLDGIVPFSLEMDQNFIGAILTIVGYSINDSVVIFDRIRENMTEFKSETNRAKLINDSINQTLSRTIMTSATVLVVVIILFLFGGVALKGFSLAMLIGVFMGSYSTIFIAAPIVVDLFKEKKNAHKA